jgi:hypothetical protein
MAVSDVMLYLSAAKSALDLFKGIKSELPHGPKADEVQKKIEKAEQALEESKAEVARLLGFRLCHCEFPPPIMLWDKERRVDVCPNCQDEYPPLEGTRQVNRGPRGRIARSRTGS